MTIRRIKLPRRMPVIVSAKPTKVSALIACAHRPRRGHVIQVDQRAYSITSVRRKGPSIYQIFAEAEAQ